MYKIPLLALLVVVFLIQAACDGLLFGLPSAYSGAEINGRIVDAETGEPLEGAAIVAHWKIYHQTLLNALAHGSATNGVLNVEEAISDRHGRYTIPAWGPIPRPSGWQIDGRYDPVLLVFKPGYETENRDNQKWDSEVMENPPFNSSSASLRRSVRDGQDIGLYKLGKKTRVQYGTDPSIKRAPIHVQSVGIAVSHLSAIAKSVPGRGEPSPLLSEKSQSIVIKMRRAIWLVEEEREKLGDEGSIITWGSAIESFIRREKAKKDGDDLAPGVIRALPRESVFPNTVPGR